VTSVAVVGGGIRLTAAYRLRTLLGGDAVITVFETTTRPRQAAHGRARRGAYDVGAEAFLARRPEMLTLLREIGLGERLAHPTKARAKIHAGGAVLSLASRHRDGRAGVGPTRCPECFRKRDCARSKPSRRYPSSGWPAVTWRSAPLLRERFGDDLVDRWSIRCSAACTPGERTARPARDDARAGVGDRFGAGSLTAAAASQLPAANQKTGHRARVRTVTGGLGTVIDRLVELSGAEIRTGFRCVR